MSATRNQTSTQQARTGRLVTAALGVFLLTGVAHSDPSPVDLAIAKKLFTDAESDEHAERWTEALDKLQQIVAIKETAGVRFHIANAEDHLGKLLAAESNYRRAAALADNLPASDRAALVDMASGALAKLTPRIPLLTIRVAADAPNARVLLDGREVPSSEWGKPQKHELGSAQIEATAPGRMPYQQSVILIAGSQATVEVQLTPQSSGTASAATAPTTAPQPPSPDKTGHRSYVAPIVVGAGTLALAGTSVFFLIKHGNLKSDTDTICADPTVICARGERDDRISEYSTLAIVTGAAAVVGLGVTTYLFVSGGSSDGAVGWSVGPSSVMVNGRFLLPCTTEPPFLPLSQSPSFPPSPSPSRRPTPSAPKSACPAATPLFGSMDLAARFTKTTPSIAGAAATSSSSPGNTDSKSGPPKTM